MNSFRFPRSPCGQFDELPGEGSVALGSPAGYTANAVGAHDASAILGQETPAVPAVNAEKQPNSEKGQ